MSSSGREDSEQQERPTACRHGREQEVRESRGGGGWGGYPESWALSFKPGFITHGLYDLEQGPPLWPLCSHF